MQDSGERTIWFIHFWVLKNELSLGDVRNLYREAEFWGEAFVFLVFFSVKQGREGLL